MPIRKLACLLAFVASPALAEAPAQRPTIGPEAAWVLPAGTPAPPARTEGASVVDLLLDQQIRLVDGGVASYRANVFRIATAEGLDSGALQLNWDPSLETLTLHHYRIVRDGKAIDLLGDGSRIQVVRREKNLENATLDGELTASQQPEDLRVGDVIELAYTITRRDPATGGRAEGLYGPQDGWAYGRYRLRVTWPKSRPVQWRPAPGAVQPVLRQVGDENELLADTVNLTTLRPPANAPARFGLVNLVDVSEFADWPAVSRRFATLFAEAATLAPGSMLKDEIARIAAATPDPKRRAELALQLVEEQVRYLFIGMNDGGFVPAPADQTWQRRYGDCKGKTALLIALLHGLGIEARAVMVNTEEGDATAHRLPTMGAFDHVIVEATIGGKPYWLDGTRLGDTRLDRLEPPDYQVGLPATAEGSALIPLGPPEAKAPQNRTSLTLDASAGIEAPAKASAEMVFHGEDAARTRMKYSGLAAADLDRALKKLWRETYDFITPETVAARLDDATGDFAITMRGLAKMDWYTSGKSGTRWYEMDRARVGWKFDTTRENELSPEAPFAFDWPEWFANHETIILPHKGAGFGLQASDIDRTVGGLYAFHRKVTLSDGVVTMDNDTHALKPELPASEAEGVRATMQELAGDGVFVRLPENYLFTAADLSALTGDKKALSRAHLKNGSILLDRGDAKAAMAEENAALAINPDLAPAHGVMALALARSEGQDERALAEADKAEAAKADGSDADLQWLGWSARGTVLLHQGAYAGALTAFNKVLAFNKDDLNALVNRGSAHLGLGQYAEALSDFDAAKAVAPGLKLDASRAVALAGVGRRDDALDAADAAIVASPDDRTIRDLRIRVRAETGDTPGALADADYLLAHKPGAHDYLVHAELLPVTDTARREADIAAALKLDAKSAAAWLLRAEGAVQTGQLDAADAALTQAERLKADSFALTGLRLDVMAKRGKAADALKLASDTVSHHPDSAQALNLVCWFKATRNLALDTALADCDKALTLSANNPAYLDSRALARLRGNDAKGAIADYSLALRHSPDLPSSLYGRGIAYARLGDRNRALADLSRARASHPDIDTIWADYGVTPPAGF